MKQGFNEQAEMTDLILPEVLQQYELKSILSQDPSNLVFEAWDAQLQRSVSIRRIDCHDADAEQIFKEARLVASLKHAAFAKIHALETVGQHLYIVSEAIVGVPLTEWISLNRGYEKASVEFTLQIASALAEAHELGLVHGDIQAKHFMIDASRQIRIKNGGFIKGVSPYSLRALDQTEMSEGIAYFAPERFANATATPASDVYALGALFYLMLNGSLPYAHLQGLAMVAALVQADAAQWTFHANISDALHQWLLTMLKRDPEQRPSFAQIVEQGRAIREAEGFSSNLSTVNLQSLQGQLASAARRKKRYGWAAIAVCLFLSAGVVWQARDDWPQIVKAITPYSETREIEQGIAALERHTQVPDSQLVEQAREHFQKVLEHTPNNAKAVGYMSLVYMSLYGNEKRDEIWMQKAKASAQQAMSLDPNLAVSLLAHSKVVQWHHQMDEALQIAEKALQLEPNNLMMWVQKARLLLERGDIQALMKFASEGVEAFPQDRVLPELKGVALATLGDVKGAERAYRLSMQRQPDSVNAYALLGNLLDRQQRTNEALQIFQRGLQVRPNAQLYGAMGQVMFRKGEFKQAAEAFEKAVSPQKGVAGSYFRWYQYAEALMWVPGREAEGIAAFKRAKELLEVRMARSPDDAFIMSHMAFIQARLGEFDQAKSLIVQSMASSIQDEPNNLALAASIFELIHERDKAFELLAQLKQLEPEMYDVVTNPIFDELRKDSRYKKFSSG